MDSVRNFSCPNNISTSSVTFNKTMNKYNNNAKQLKEIIEIIFIKGGKIKLRYLLCDIVQ